DLVLTNYHVLEATIEGKVPSRAIACRFDYKVLSDGSRSEGVVAALRDADWSVDFSRYSRGDADDQPDRELPSIDELDYALVRLPRPVGNEPVDRRAGAGAPPRGWVEFPAAQPPLDAGMPLLIVQHPDGSPLQLAFDTDSIISVNGNGT